MGARNRTLIPNRGRPRKPQNDQEALRFRGAFCFLVAGGARMMRDLPCLDRVVVVGANGAGKTWLARKLAAMSERPLIHNDALALTTGWRHRPRADVAAARARLIAEPAWVLEGGPSILTAAVLARATAVIWLDVAWPPRVRRIFWRGLRYTGQVRPEHPPGNREWPGLRQMRFLWRAWLTDGAFRTVVAERLAGTGVAVVRLTRNADVSAFIKAAGERAERL